MSFFKALGKLSSAVVNTALIPLDVTVDTVTGFERNNTAARAKKIKEDLEESYEETFEDQ
jgi:hypothetical protein